MCGLRGVPVGATRRKTRRFPGCIDAPHLHRHGGKPRNAPHQDHHKGGDGERCLDGGAAVIGGQTLVFRARLMMLVSAVTMESPVTTV